MKRTFIAAALAVGLAAIAAGCGGESDAGGGSAEGAKLTLVAYSTPRCGRTTSRCSPTPSTAPSRR